MDPIQKGSKKGVAKDAILCHEGESGLDYQRLAYAVVVTSSKTIHDDRHGEILQAQRDDRI